MWYGEKVSREALYDLRRKVLPILDSHKIGDFLVLNEPKYVLLRVNIGEDVKRTIEESLNRLVRESQDAFSRVTVDTWNPETDARDRIFGAAQRLGLRLQDGKGWKIVGREPLNRQWVPMPDDLESKIAEFSNFMTKVVGKFTRAYVEHMSGRMEDRWLLSVMLHLLLNSISLNQFEENEAREFSYV
jgi:hypothetical protein